MFTWQIEKWQFPKRFLRHVYYDTAFGVNQRCSKQICILKILYFFTKNMHITEALCLFQITIMYFNSEIFFAWISAHTRAISLEKISRNQMQISHPLL